MGKVIKANFDQLSGNEITTESRYQYDYGMILKFGGAVTLPQAYEVHFALDKTGDAVTQIGGADGVTVPDSMFMSGAPIYAWVYLHDSETDGYTQYTAIIPVIKRAAPSDLEPTPVQQSAIDQAIAALGVAVEQTAADVEATAANAENAQASAEAAANSAAEAAETAEGVETNVTAAQAAKAAAESARDRAVQAETAAATSETNAAASATAASLSEIAAKTAETGAQTSATAAANSAAAALTSEENANGAMMSAYSDANRADTAADTATSAKSDAVSAKNAAVSAMTAAETAAGTATTKATAAANSATAAANSATAAAGSATEAATTAQGISEHLDQIDENTDAIDALKEDLVHTDIVANTINYAFAYGWEVGFLSNGVVNPSATGFYTIKDYIPFKKGNVLNVSVSDGTTSTMFYSMYDENKQHISSSNRDINGSLAWESVNDANAYVKVCFSAGFYHKISITPKNNAFDALTNEMQNLAGDLREDLGYITDVQKIAITGHHEFIDLSGTSVTMSGGEPVSSGDSASYNYCLVSCQKGDKFTINGTGGSQTRLWGFISSTGAILSKANASVTADSLVIEAPENAAFLIIHGKDATWESSFKGELVSVRIEHVADENSALRTNLNAVVDGALNIGTISKFSRGTLSAGQILIDGYSYRVVSSDIIKVPYQIELASSSGFSFKLCFYEDGVYVSETAYVNEYSIPKNTEFKIAIRRTTEDTTETADIDEFTASVTGYTFKNIEKIYDLLVGKNLCGNDPTTFYPVEFVKGEILTLSTSTGETPDYIELEFYDENYNKLGVFSLMASTRTVTIYSNIASAKYIKWSTTPSVPLQVEIGGTKTAYTEYEPNVYAFREESKTNADRFAYIAGPVPIVAVMSYNVGEWYNGTRTEMPSSDYELYEGIQKEIMLKNYASIFCAQEYYYLMHPGALDSKHLFLYPLFKQVATYDDTQMTLGKAIATNLRMISSEAVDFVNKSGVAQKYQKSYLYINGHKVCVCNVHLSQLDEEQALLEAQEVAAAMSDEEYFIVLGDFNVSFIDTTGEAIIDAFEAIGAKACNCGDFGVFNTYRGSELVGTSDEPIDNIFVSSNITIKSVYMDTTKIDADLPIQDHVPLIAYLEIL